MLAGQTVLIVETEIIISLSVQALLHNLGATRVLVLTSPKEFGAGQRSWDDVVLAILEVEADRADQFELIKAAIDAGIAVLGLTADGQLRKGVPGLPDIPIMVKPVSDDILGEAIMALLQRHYDLKE